MSTNGGTEPRWRGDGGELFYMTPVKVPITITVNWPALLER